MDKQLEIVLRKMFSMVDTEYSPEFVAQPDWFLKHEWTSEQEDDFVMWLAEYLYNNKEARKSLLRWSTKNKKICVKAAKQFNFQYGWKTK